MKLNRAKKAIFKIIQPADGGAFGSRMFDMFITALVLLSVVCVFATTFDLSDGLVRHLNVLESIISIVFTIEYVLRLLTADLLYPDMPPWKAAIRHVCSGMAIIDLLAILPFYLPMVFSCNLLAIRIFRLLRLMRVFKLNRYFESLAAIGEVLCAKSRELLGSMFIVMLMLILSSLAIYEVEHDAQPGMFKNAFSGLWWAVATLTTVGYGDIYPVTTLGRVFGAIIALLGVGMVAIPTGIISSGLIECWDRNKEGLVRYKFRDHGIVIGWDFQGPSCVKALLKDCAEVLVVSGMDAKAIRRELELSIRTRDLSRVYIYNGLVTTGGSTLANSWPELSKGIVILGECNGLDNDGGNLHIERVLRRHIKAATAKLPVKRPPIKVYLHIEDAVLYTQALAMPKEGFEENDDLIDLEVYNYYESWAWQCWSLKDACDKDQDGCSENEHEGSPYLPLRHKPDAERVELFIVGSSMMGQAMANYAMPLMNYGEDRKHCKITIFDDCAAGGVFLPEKWALDALPEVDVVFKNVSGGSDEANDIMIRAASDPKTAVTIVIATPGPDAAVKSYAELANSLRRMDVSILVWQATTTDKCPRKPFLQTCGDRAKLRFFGMTDRLPWKNPARQMNGSAVNYFYDIIFNWDSARKCWKDGSLPEVVLPEATDDSLVATAKRAWIPELAMERWLAVQRWAKWSSISSSGSFKEKAFAFSDCATNVETRKRMLHAEHNRWWTERLLAGWKPCEKPLDADKALRKKKEAELKSSYQHWDMVPFDQLDAYTKDLDKVNIAAMAACGYIDCLTGGLA